MRCEDCTRYDSELKKCLDSKLNPQSWSAAIDVSNLMGLRVICVFNDHRERLVKCRANTNHDLESGSTSSKRLG